MEINGVVIDNDVIELFRTGVKTVTEKDNFKYVERLKEQNNVYGFSNKQQYIEFLDYVDAMNSKAHTNRINSWSNSVCKAFDNENINDIYFLISYRGNLVYLKAQDAEVLFNKLIVAPSLLVDSAIDAISS